MNNKFLLGFLVIFSSFVFYSCTKDDIAEVGTQPSDFGVRFALSNPSVIEADPVTGLFTLTVLRNGAGDALDVPVSAVSDEDNMFSVPASIHFDAGQDTTYLTVSMPTSAPLGEQYKLSIKIDDAYSNPYLLDGSSVYSVSASLSIWKNIGFAEYYDDFVYGGTFVFQLPFDQSLVDPTMYRIAYPYSDEIMIATGNDDEWMGGQTQLNVVYTVTADDHVTWAKFWYTHLIYYGNDGQEIKAYLPSALATSLKDDDALSIVGERDGDGNILYLELHPYYYIDGVGGYGDSYAVYVGFPGYDLAGALGYPLYEP